MGHRLEKDVILIAFFKERHFNSVFYADSHAMMSNIRHTDDLKESFFMGQRSTSVVFLSSKGR